MYIGPANSRQQLGALGFDPISAIFTGAALKNLFGIGKKKAAFKEMESSAGGQYAQQFPPNVDWAHYLDKPADDPKETRTHRQIYEALRGVKDSFLLKKKIATPEDYAAWVVLERMSHNIIDPFQTNPNIVTYKLAPRDKESKINIFDEKRLTDYYASKGKSAPGKPPTKLPTTTTPVDAPKIKTAQIPVASSLTQPQTFDIAAILGQIFGGQPPPVPAPTAASPAPLPAWIIPAALLGAGAFLVSMRDKRKRRR